MRVTSLGVFFGLTLVIAATGIWSVRSRVFAQISPEKIQDLNFSGESRDLITFATPGPNGEQNITLIDPVLRVMSVYGIDAASGEITLKSVRNIRWDLLMDEFNGASPSPQEIRILLEQR